MAKLRVTLVRSRIRANGHQEKVLDGLNLKRINAVSELEDTPSVRGMIQKVDHLVAVETA